MLIALESPRRGQGKVVSRRSHKPEDSVRLRGPLPSLPRAVSRLRQWCCSVAPVVLLAWAALFLGGSSWQQSADGPPERYTECAWAPAQAQVVCFGGYGIEASGADYGILDETWTLNSAGTWTYHLPVHRPPARSEHVVATYQGGVVVVGGQDAVQVFSDTWTWDSADWTLDAHGGLPAITRAGGAWAEWTANECLIIVGGYHAGQLSPRVWYLRPSRLAWLSVLPPCGPGGRDYPAVAWDGQGLLMHGGSVAADTWRLSVAFAWQHLSNMGPGARLGQSMAYHEERGRVVLFGGWQSGSYYPDDAWEWDGSAWSLGAAPGPEGRFFPAMAYDGVRIMVYGGTQGFPWYYRDTWRYRIPAPPIGGGPVQ